MGLGACASRWDTGTGRQAGGGRKGGRDRQAWWEGRRKGKGREGRHEGMVGRWQAMPPCPKSSVCLHSMCSSPCSSSSPVSPAFSSFLEKFSSLPSKASQGRRQQHTEGRKCLM